jgi:hypothetical protein
MLKPTKVGDAEVAARLESVMRASRAIRSEVALAISESSESRATFVQPGLSRVRGGAAERYGVRPINHKLSKIIYFPDAGKSVNVT